MSKTNSNFGNYILSIDSDEIENHFNIIDGYVNFEGPSINTSKSGIYMSGYDEPRFIFVLIDKELRLITKNSAFHITEDVIQAFTEAKRLIEIIRKDSKTFYGDFYVRWNEKNSVKTIGHKHGGNVGLVFKGGNGHPAINIDAKYASGCSFGPNSLKSLNGIMEDAIKHFDCK